MDTYTAAAKIIVALSIAFVWVFRFDNIVTEFHLYGLNDLTRASVGTAKIVLATLLVVGIWYPALALVPAGIMALLMVAAQYFHFKARNPWVKHLPSFLLLALCLFIMATSPQLAA